MSEKSAHVQIKTLKGLQKTTVAFFKTVIFYPVTLPFFLLFKIVICLEI